MKGLDKTEVNREVVKNFLYDVMQGNRPEKPPDCFDGDTYIQHNTGIADGLSGPGAALAALAGHWDAMETIADKSAWQNENGKF